jgi:hypothetical protein
LLGSPLRPPQGAENRGATDFFLAIARHRGCTVNEFVFRSRLDPSYRSELERAVFFNPEQRGSERGIAEGVEIYGAPMIVSDAEGLHIVVSRRQDAQCLFALSARAGRVMLAGMIVFLRTSRDEVTVLHVAVADHFGRSRDASLAVVVAMVGAVRGIAHRLRGVKRLKLLYLRDRAVPVTSPRHTPPAA